MSLSLYAHLNQALEEWASGGPGALSVATPYLTQSGVDALVAAAGADALSGSRWLVSLNVHNAIGGSTEPEAVRRLLGLGADVRTLDSLHAKLYMLADVEPLIIGSANLTGGGLFANEELVALVHDGQVRSRAAKLFDSWWEDAIVVTPEFCVALEWEAERVSMLQASADAMMQLMGLGAFAAISTSPSATKHQRRKLDWKDIGVPTPAAGVATPPTLRLWPKKVHDGLNLQIAACRRWVGRNAVRHDGRHFLPRELFGDLDATVRRANEQFESRVDAIAPEDWQTHREDLERQVRSWLETTADDQKRPPDWTAGKLQSIMRRVPHRAKIGGGPTIIQRLDVPHPENVPDIDGLVAEVRALLQRHPIQTRLSGFEGTAEP